MKNTEDPKDSLKTTMVTNARDWAQDKADAWIYGVVVGWDDSFAELAKSHGWDEATTQRWQRLHAAFQRLEPAGEVVQENAKLREENQRLLRAYVRPDDLREQLEAAKAENARLREALAKIESAYGNDETTARFCKGLAREALEENKEAGGSR